MRTNSVFAIAGFSLAICCIGGSAQANHKIRIALTQRSNVSTSEVGKGLDRHCPDVIISDDPQKADYDLEAWDTGAGPGRKPYKFTLFKDQDRVFSTETRGIAGAVKDVCTYIEKQKR
jgi:hypothetical protein